jgi:hypothetical protein
MRYCAIMSPERETCYEAFAIPSRIIITLAGIFDFQARAARGKGKRLRTLLGVTSMSVIRVTRRASPLVRSFIASCPLLYRRDDGAAR